MTTKKTENKNQKESLITPGPKKLTTAVGQEVPEHLIHIFERVNEIKVHINQFNKMLRHFKQKEKEGDELYQYVKVNPLEVEAKNVTRTLRFAIPYAICGYCGGDTSMDTCRACNGTGWVNKRMWELTPEDLKK